jgi:hypothetical protein
MATPLNTLTPDVLGMNLTTFDPDVESALPTLGELTTRQTQALIRMSGVHGFVTLAESVEKARELTPQTLVTLEQCFQVLIRARDAGRLAKRNATIAANQQVAPTRDTIGRLTATLEQCQGASPALDAIIEAWTGGGKLYLPENFNESNWISANSALRNAGIHFGVIEASSRSGSQAVAEPDVAEEDPIPSVTVEEEDL